MYVYICVYINSYEEDIYIYIYLELPQPRHHIFPLTGCYLDLTIQSFVFLAIL